jgi:hypothetical protein
MKPMPKPSAQQPIITSDREKHVAVKSASPLKDALEGVVFRLLGSHLWDKLYTLFSESRSFLGRLCTQLAKDRVFVSLGPSLEFHHQSWQRNKRTLARKKGIENLLAIHPWAAHQDFEMFLMGFDAGEQWASHTLSNRPHPDQDSS